MIRWSSISTRLMLFLPLLLVALAVTVSFGLTEVRQSLIDDRKEALKNIVQIGRHVLDVWHEKETSGQLSRDAAQQGARDELSSLRFGDNNYFFIHRYDGVTLLHVDRTLEGKNRIDTTDPYGVQTVRRMIELAQHGEGYVAYHNPRRGGTSANSTDTIPKLSYVLGFEPWQWAIGAGIYVDDVDSIYNSLLRRYAAIAIAVLLIGGAVAHLIARSISRPLSLITGSMRRLAGGDLAIEIPQAERRDEIGEMASALRVFKDNAAAAQQLHVERERRRELEVQAVLHHAQRLDALARLAGGIAHDLNNALVPVLGMTKLIMSRVSGDARDRARLEVILVGAQRAKDLVEQILAFSRKQDVEQGDLDLGRTIADGVTMLQPGLPATIKLVTSIDPVPAIRGDPELLTQVLVNLVTNSAQAIGDRPGTITIAVGMDGAARVRLTVSDTGCGMDDATRHRIFEPFFTTKTVGEGTGLGLSVVHGIVASHGGTIIVRSAPGEGTQIDIFLPIARDQADPLGAAPVRQEAPAIYG